MIATRYLLDTELTIDPKCYIDLELWDDYVNR